MMNNKRIASELNRVAKSLISADGVADTEGKYKNFTGIIKWAGSQGKVRNATFELDDSGVSWKNGVWESGKWWRGVWNGGTWKDGDWEEGIWKGGTWMDGTWWRGAWLDGTWKRGWWGYGDDRHGVGHAVSPDKW